MARGRAAIVLGLCIFGFLLLISDRLFAAPVTFGITLSTSITSTPTTAVTALDQAQAVGAQYVRVAAEWPRVMPRAGGQDFAWLDAIVQAALARHLKVILVLGPSPRWSVSYLDADAAEDEILRAQPDLPAYRAYVTAVARHYKTQVFLYQLWQRPSCNTLLAVACDVYTLFREGARAIHTVNPDLQVIAAEPGNVDLTWLNGYMKSVSGIERPDGLLLTPISFATSPMVFAMRTQALQRLILKHAASPALWAEIPLVEPPANPRLALAAMALVTGCHHLVFSAPADATESTSLKTVTDFVRPLCGEEYGGWSRKDGHYISSMFHAQDHHSLLIFPQIDEQLTVNPLTTPHDAELNAQDAQITITAPDCPPTVLQITTAHALPVVTAHPLLLSGVTVSVTPGFPDLTPTPYPNDTVKVDISGTDVNGIHPLHEMPGGHYATRIFNDQTILRTTTGNPWIHFSVPTSFLFFNIAQVPVDITVEMMGVDAPERSGFNIYYDALAGMRYTTWQWIDVGIDKVFSYTFRLNDALFAGNGGYDFRINMGASKEYLRVLGVSIKKIH